MKGRDVVRRFALSLLIWVLKRFFRVPDVHPAFRDPVGYAKQRAFEHVTDRFKRQDWVVLLVGGIALVLFAVEAVGFVIAMIQTIVAAFGPHDTVTTQAGMFYRLSRFGLTSAVLWFLSFGLVLVGLIAWLFIVFRKSVLLREVSTLPYRRVWAAFLAAVCFHLLAFALTS